MMVMVMVMVMVVIMVIKILMVMTFTQGQWPVSMWSCCHGTGGCSEQIFTAFYFHVLSSATHLYRYIVLTYSLWKLPALSFQVVLDGLLHTVHCAHWPSKLSSDRIGKSFIELMVLMVNSKITIPQNVWLNLSTMQYGCSCWPLEGGTVWPILAFLVSAHILFLVQNWIGNTLVLTIFLVLYTPANMLYSIYL